MLGFYFLSSFCELGALKWSVSFTLLSHVLCNRMVLIRNRILPASYKIYTYIYRVSSVDSKVTKLAQIQNGSKLNRPQNVGLKGCFIRQAFILFVFFFSMTENQRSYNRYIEYQVQKVDFFLARVEANTIGSFIYVDQVYET